MINKKLRATIILISLLLNIIFIPLYYLTQKEKNEILDDVELDILDQRNYKDLLFNYIETFSIYSGNGVLFPKIELDRTRLIYRYFTNDCSSCINEDLEIIRKFIPQIDLKNELLIFPSAPDNRENRILLNNQLNEFEYVQIKDNEMNIEIKGKLSKRYFAIVDSSNILKMIFIPSLGQSNLTKEYLRHIKEKYF